MLVLHRNIRQSHLEQQVSTGVSSHGLKPHGMHMVYRAGSGAKVGLQQIWKQKDSGFWELYKRLRVFLNTDRMSVTSRNQGLLSESKSRS